MARRSNPPSRIKHPAPEQMAAAISLVALFLVAIGMSTARCTPAEERAVRAPNAVFADCAADKGIEERKCIKRYRADQGAEIAACIEGVRMAKTSQCLTEAGLAAYVTSIGDGGGE